MNDDMKIKSNKILNQTYQNLKNKNKKIRKKRIWKNWYRTLSDEEKENRVRTELLQSIKIKINFIFLL